MHIKSGLLSYALKNKIALKSGPKVVLVIVASYHILAQKTYVAVSLMTTGPVQTQSKGSGIRFMGSGNSCLHFQLVLVQNGFQTCG